MTALLETRGVAAGYGDFQALFGIDLRLDRGETIAVIGANGAGKTTLMRAVSGLIRRRSGTILHNGEDIGDLPADAVMGRGVVMVPEGRRLFASLTVEENLLAGVRDRLGPLSRLFGWRNPAEASDNEGGWTLESIYGLFPALRERRNNPSSALSGGQQQMVAIGRALMSNPDVLLCDEISLGLAPAVIKDVYAALPRIRERGASVIVVEQDVGQALAVADRFYCMMEGRVTLEGSPSEVTRERISEAYFGTAAQGGTA